jgi:hypothetical protein
VAGFVLSLVACGLLVASFGLSSLLSVGCAIFGIVQSRKGRRRVVAGETRKHQGLAHAGYVIGIVGLVLAVLATLFWALAIGAGGISGDLENDPNELEPIRVALLGGALLGLR